MKENETRRVYDLAEDLKIKEKQFFVHKISFI